MGLVLHTWIYHQGHDMWSPPHFVANELGVPDALPYGSSRAATPAPALRLAAMHLAAEPGVGAALVTTGDRFRLPVSTAGTPTTAWASATGGRGAGAPRRRRPDDYALLSMSSATAAHFELMMRHGDDFSPHPCGTALIDLRVPRSPTWRCTARTSSRNRRRMIRKVIVDSIRDAGLGPTTPGSSTSRCHGSVGTCWTPSTAGAERRAEGRALRFGATTGHLGCGRLPANLADLRDRVPLQPGDVALVISGGAAWTWASAVVPVRRGATDGPGLLGLGGYVPPVVIDNAQVAGWTGMDENWIVERTGILERRYREPGTTTSDLALTPPAQALAGRPEAEDRLGLIVVATSTPDQPQPSTGAILQNKLGLSGIPAFDVNAVCCGFLLALAVADVDAVGAGRRAGPATTPWWWARTSTPRLMNRTDRRTVSLFGDGAGAALLGPVPEGYGMLAWRLVAHGRAPRSGRGARGRHPQRRWTPGPGRRANTCSGWRPRGARVRAAHPAQGGR